MCDWQTMIRRMEADPLVHRLRAFLPSWTGAWRPSGLQGREERARPPHSLIASIKALLLTISEGLTSCTRVRRFLVSHPLLMLELGFRPKVNPFVEILLATSPCHWERRQCRKAWCASVGAWALFTPGK
jgi:hypothetical protein